VTAVEERDGGRVAVFVDGREAFTVRAAMLERLGIEVGGSLPDEQLAGTERSPELAKARDAALRLLGVRARSARELRDRLHGKGFSDETSEQVLAGLERVGLVDDRAFARLWIEERVRLRPIGRRRAVSELLAKGVGRRVAQAVADEVYAEHPQAELAARALEPKLRAGRAESPKRRRRRLEAFLLRRGFSYDVIATALREAEEVSGSDQDG